MAGHSMQDSACVVYIWVFVGQTAFDLEILKGENRGGMDLARMGGSD